MARRALRILAGFWVALLLAPGLPALPLGLGAALVATEAAAQRSSGGYARPRSSPGGSYGRTPSIRGPRATPRTPSTSGGYRRPDFGAAPAPRRPSVAPPFDRRSAGDRELSRGQSADALRRYREQSEAARRPAPPVPNTAPAPIPGGIPGGGGFGLPPRGGPGYSRPPRPDWYRDRGWFPQPGLFGAGRSFGIWDGVFLWFLLDNLSRAGSLDFFRNHRDDPAIREWRAEADRLARDNAELRARLDRLDRELAASPEAPRDPDYLPPGIPPEIALAPRDDIRTPTTGPAEAEGGGGGGMLLPLLLLGAGGAALLVISRRRRAAGGPPMEDHGTAGRLRSAGRMARAVATGGVRSAPTGPFRVGMVLQADPTPFILAAGTKVPPPEGIEAGGSLGVQEVGHLRGAGVELLRLHLADGRSLFQIHLDAAGRPDECRFFGLIDEVTPADEGEWAVWLHPQEGLIGWPEFQTRDGQIYARAWAPGAARIEPRDLTETIEGPQGTRSRRLLAMLYAAPTGAAPPAPTTEYILVAAVEAEGRAWVEIRAGLDINPASLSLS